MRCFLCRTKNIIRMIFKSKTDIFLLAYILFLITSLFLYPFWDNSFATKMIAAISVSGAVFSLAELCYTIQSLKNDKLQQSCELLKLSIKAMKELLLERKKNIDELTNRINLQYVTRGNLPEQEKAVIENNHNQFKELILNETAKYEADYSKTQKTIENIQDGIDAMKKKISDTSIPGNVLMVLGILLFLIFITLNSSSAIELLSPYLTIAAFALLMINYFVKQVYASNMKIDIEALKEQYGN